jgi:hypothetical protein
MAGRQRSFPPFGLCHVFVSSLFSWIPVEWGLLARISICVGLIRWVATERVGGIYGLHPVEVLIVGTFHLRQHFNFQTITGLTIRFLLYLNLNFVVILRLCGFLRKSLFLSLSTIA